MKKGILTALLVMGALCMAACQKKNVQDDGSDDGSHETGDDIYTYVSEQISLGLDIPVDSLRVEGNRLYYFQEGDGQEGRECLNCLDLEKPKEGPFSVYEEIDDGAEREGYETKVVKMFLDPNGEVIVITQQAPVMDPETASETDWKKWQTESSYEMKKITEEGKTAFSVDITGYILSDAEAPYLQYAFADGEGRLFLTNGISRVWIFDGEGRYIHEIKLAENVLLGAYMKFGILGDGRAVIGTDANEGRSMNLVAYCVDKKDFAEVYDNLPPSLWGTEIVKGPDGETLVWGSRALYEYDLETRTYEEKIRWKEWDMDEGNVRYAVALSNGSIVVLYDDGDGRKEWILLKRTVVSPETDRTILTLARIPQDYEDFVPWELGEEVIRFNKENTAYRIEVKEYKDQEAFYYDILAGNIPDLFDPEGINIRLLAGKGIIEDLSPYLENSSVVKREDLFESVLDACTIDGTLCTIPVRFWIETLFGRSSEVGEQAGWTRDEMIKLLDEHGDKTLFAYEDRELVLYFLIQYSSDAYVDWENGKCYFDSEEFQKVLELASRYGEYEDDISEPGMLSKGKALLCRYLVSGFWDWQLLESVFHEPVTAIGFPGDLGTTVVRGIDEVCISAGSANKEGAWSFIESLLADRDGEEDAGFPIRRSAYEALLEDAMEPCYACDEEGNVIPDENGMPVEIPRFTGCWEDFDYEIYAVTQEEADSLTGLIEQIDGIMYFEPQLYQIILEEAEPYFEGQKTAEEAAKIIQGRATVFVNENIK